MRDRSESSSNLRPLDGVDRGLRSCNVRAAVHPVHAATQESKPMGKGRKQLSMKAGPKLTAQLKQQPAQRAPLIRVHVSKHAKQKGK